MTGGAIGVGTVQAWIRTQTTHNVVEHFSVGDSCSFNEFDLDGGGPEYHESMEKVGQSLDVQTHIKGRVVGASATLKRYEKPRGGQQAVAA